MLREIAAKKNGGRPPPGVKLSSTSFRISGERVVGMFNARNGSSLGSLSQCPTS